MTIPALQETGKRLGKYVSESTGEAKKQRDPAVVEAEKTVRQMLLDGVTPPKELAVMVEMLDLPGVKGNRSKIPNPKHIELLQNLKDLRTFYSDLRLADIGTLTNLTSLSVQANEVSDITALGKLTNLTRLSVDANGVSDLTALGKLTNLTSLTVHAKRIDFKGVPNLFRLTLLKISTRDFLNLGEIGSLSELQEVAISNVVGPLDLRPFEKCPKLRRIKLTNVTVSNYGTLKHLVI